MSTVVALFTFVLSGLAWADCRTTEAVDSETIPPTSRKLLRETGYQHVSAGQDQLAMACYAEARNLYARELGVLQPLVTQPARPSGKFTWSWVDCRSLKAL